MWTKSLLRCLNALAVFYNIIFRDNNQFAKLILYISQRPPRFNCCYIYMEQKNIKFIKKKLFLLLTKVTQFNLFYLNNG